MGLKKEVIQLKDNKKVAVYDSVTKAAHAIGSTKSKISKCCAGTLKQVNGFAFRYSGEYTNQRINNGKLKCPYCENKFETYNGLCKHVFKHKSHDNVISREELLTNVKYNGKRPTCKCGCGEYTNISYVGGVHFSDYAVGHASRIHNNWGHNDKAKKHSAETRKKQYKSGERTQWNKNKSWSETYSEEKIKELMDKYLDKDRNNKISAALKGIPKSKEHAEKCRENGRSEKSIKANREKMYNKLMSGEFSLSSDIEKEFIKECIQPLNIEYTTQYYIKEIRHYCDVYISNKNLIIEFQGDYWHGNPKKYTKDKLSDYQLKRIKKDEELRKYCSEHGINLVEVWESDYNSNSNNIKKMLNERVMLL